MSGGSLRSGHGQNPRFRRSRKPVNSRCRICERCTDLDWDHCHKCGKERGWICPACNTALTEHIEQHWSSAEAYLSSHQCDPALFDALPASRKVESRPSTHTRQVHFGQGRNDPRYYYASKLEDAITVEQMAAVMGVTAGTARDWIDGRRGQVGFRRDGTIFISHIEALKLLHSRWNID